MPSDGGLTTHCGLRSLAGALLAACLALPAVAKAAGGQGTEDSGSDLQAMLARTIAAGCSAGPRRGVEASRSTRLDEAARLMIQGQTLAGALERARYFATRAAYFSLTGWRTGADLAPEVLTAACFELARAHGAEMGIHAEASRAVLVTAVPWRAEVDDPAAVQRIVLQLTNEARAKPRQCGPQSFAKARPLAEDVRLHTAAQQHASDLLQGRTLRHVGADGRAPGQRLRDAGYRWRSVGENLAAGQPSPAEVVQAWLENPLHCANLMNPGFRHMGLAFATKHDDRPGIYWVQVFASPP
jgi:uncharacterized protein YkwD